MTYNERIYYLMNKLRYIYWQDDEMWLGYLEEYPDYMTQGETIEELEENLRDIRLTALFNNTSRRMASS